MNFVFIICNKAYQINYFERNLVIITGGTIEQTRSQNDGLKQFFYYMILVQH